MPYIKEHYRFNLANGYADPDDPGELNFLISTIVKKYWQDHTNYQGINDIIGALEGAKMEFYARIARPYEDKKIAENGDVY